MVTKIPKTSKWWKVLQHLKAKIPFPPLKKRPKDKLIEIILPGSEDRPK